MNCNKYFRPSAQARTLIRDFPNGCKLARKMTKKIRLLIDQLEVQFGVRIDKMAKILLEMASKSFLKY